MKALKTFLDFFFTAALMSWILFYTMPDKRVMALIPIVILAVYKAIYGRLDK